MISSPEKPPENDHNYSKEKLKLLLPRKPEGSKPSNQKKEKTKRQGSPLQEILVKVRRSEVLMIWEVV